MTIDYAAMTLAELREERAQLDLLIHRREVLETGAAQVARIAARHEAAVAAEPAREWDGTVVGPGGLTVEDGEEYRNVSGGWLSHPPSEYRRGWQRTSVEPGPEAPVPWEEGLLAEVGHLFTWEGVTYRCRQKHTTHSGWIPGPMTWAVWDVVTP